MAMAKGGKRPAPQWKPCPAGKLSALSTRIQRRTQRRRFLQFAGAFSLLALGGGTLGFLLTRQREFDYGGITCSEVLGHAEAFMRGQLGEPLTGKIRLHLAECPSCGPRFRDMQSKMVT